MLKEPPATPLPDPVEQPQWYGELWVRYPLTQSPVPTHHGFQFKARAEFWTIMNEFSCLAFSDHRAPCKLSINQIFTVHNRLKAWLHNLPEPLTPKNIVLPHQLKLHMQYNHMLIDLFTPALSYAGSELAQLDKTPHDIYSEALIHQETLIRLYYLRHGFEAFDSFILHFLGFLNHITMDAVEKSTGSSFLESRRSTLLLLTKGIHDQSRLAFVAKVILRLQVRVMRPEDVDLLQRFVEIETDQVISEPLGQVVHTDWPVYEAGHEAKADLFRQGQTLASALASMSLEPSATPSPTRSPS